MTSSSKPRPSPLSRTRPSSRRRTARSWAGRRGRIAAKAARPLPRRTCVACRTERAKRELVRVVRAAGSGELSVDLRGKASGRGAYVCADAACLERGLAEGTIARALETEIDPAARDRLASELRRASDERARTK